VCPTCRSAPLEITHTASANDERLLDGMLGCEACGASFPVLDGIPVLVPDPRSFLAQNVLLAVARDLPEPLAAWIGEASGQNSAWDANRQHLSSYGHDHYGPEGGRATALLEAARPPGGGLALDLGCGPGAATHALAKDHELVLGLDLHLGLLRLAHQVLRSGVARFPVRELGVRYRPVDRRIGLEHPERVDFWCCDASTLPLADGVANTAISMNLVDCVPSPPLHLEELGRVLAPGGHAVLATPFDWAPHVTPQSAWLDPDGLVAALPESLAVSSRQDHPWGVYVHGRRTSRYDALLLGLRKV